MDNSLQHEVKPQSESHRQLVQKVYADKSVYNEHPLALNRAVWLEESMHIVFVFNSGTHIVKVDEELFKDKKGVSVLRSGKTCHLITKKAVKDNQAQAHMLYLAKMERKD